MDTPDLECLGIISNRLLVNVPPYNWIGLARRKMLSDFFLVVATWDKLLYYLPFNRFIEALVLPVDG